jgi:hypothetical protein
MTTADVVRLLLGSAVLNAIVSAVITGWFNRNITHQELTAEAEWRDRQRREDRLKIAAELVRLKQEMSSRAGDNQARR